MFLIVGLGNPGRKFIKTRHNLGFRILNNFRKRNKFSNWKEKKRLKAKISEKKIGKKKIILAKSQAFMNDSGKSVKLLAKTYHLTPDSLIVIHDDLDIPLGKMKISKGRRSAGHKGVQSIIDELGTKDFVRFRIGISPINKEQQTISSIFVLQKFTKEEEKILKEVVKRICQLLKRFSLLISFFLSNLKIYFFSGNY